MRRLFCPQRPLESGFRRLPRTQPPSTQLLRLEHKWRPEVKAALEERDSQQEKEHSRGEGEEEADSRQRSPMWDSIPRPRDHALSLRQTLNNCATPPRQVFQPHCSLWWKTADSYIPLTRS